jgi:uncharacterized membrane protein YkvA (DUF1232 family)
MTLIEKLKSWAELLKMDVLMVWFATKSPKTPWLPKAICIFIVAYALSPIDPVSWGFLMTELCGTMP